MTSFNDTAPAASRHEALAARLWRAAELQAAEVEARIAAGPRPAAEAERDAKTLSVLARTLRELSAADGFASGGPEDNDEGIPPEDIEALRTQLGEQLRALADARSTDLTGDYGHGAG